MNNNRSKLITNAQKVPDFFNIITYAMLYHGCD